jgi:hypothetical protein
MRGLVAATIGLIVVFAVPVEAAPIMKPAGHGVSAVQPAAGGCGAGYHRQYWRGADGYQHSRCVPD